MGDGAFPIQPFAEPNLTPRSTDLIAGDHTFLAFREMNRLTRPFVFNCQPKRRRNAVSTA